MGDGDNQDFKQIRKRNGKQEMSRGDDSSLPV